MVYYARLNDVEEDEVGYWVDFPDLPSCFTQGDTKEEALAMAEDVLNLMLEDNEITFKKPTNYEGKAGYYAIPVKPSIAIALKLRWVREEQKLTQNDVAKRLNVAYQVYQKYENPRKNNVTINTIEKLQNALGIKLVTI